MQYIAISLISFLLTVTAHILIHRFLAKYKIITFKTTVVFIIGFSINTLLIFLKVTKCSDEIICLNNWWTFSIPVTSSILYILLVFDYLAFFASPYLGDESPSSKIFLLVRKKKTATFAQIINTFSNQELISKRIDDLVRSKLVEKSGNQIVISDRGKTFLKIMNLYRKLLVWEMIG